MPNSATAQVAVIGIDIGKNAFHLIGLDKRGRIVLKAKLGRSQLDARMANMPPCLIGMEACSVAHHLSRKLAALSISTMTPSLSSGTKTADAAQERPPSTPPVGALDYDGNQASESV